MTRTLISIVLSFFAISLAAASWTSHGPVGGSVSRIGVAATDRSVIYAATPDGLFRTRDSGASWSNVTGPIVSVAELVVLNPDAVVVAASNGVFRTDDGGATWQAAAGLPSTMHADALIADPRDANRLLAGIFDPNCYITGNAAGVYESTDGGRSFHLSVNGMAQYQRCIGGLAVDPLNPSRFYSSWAFAEINGYSRSDDGGATWTGVQNVTPDRALVAAKGQRFGIAYLGEELTTSGDGVTWSGIFPRGIEPASGFRYFALDVDPNVGRLFLATSDGAYRSGNGGLDWLRLGGAARDTSNAIDFDTATGSVLLGTDQGLFRSAGYPWDDWTDLHVPTASRNVSQLVAAPAGNDVYAVSGRHVFRSSDFGMSWQEAGGPMPEYVSTIVVDAGNQLYSVNFGNGAYHIRKQLDSGDWEEIRKVGSFSGLVADPNEPGTLYSTELSAIYRTRDGGANWERLAPPIPQGLFPGPVITDPRGPNRLMTWAGSLLFSSVDGGQSWTSNKVASLDFVQMTVRSSSDPDVLYVRGVDQNFNRVLGRSGDDGATWTTLGLPPIPSFDQVAQLVVDRRDANTIYVSTLNSGLFRSTDGGRSWQSIDAGLPAQPGSAIAMDSKGAFLHAAVMNRGVWELPAMGRRRIAERQQ